MYVSHVALQQFRSYPLVDIDLEPGVTAFVGRNGQGKTNLVEAVDYLSRLRSHRVASDAPLVRAGQEQAVIRASVVKDGRTAVLEAEINVGKSNKARINKSTLPRVRDLAGLLRTVVFSPEDLALVKGDPSDRRTFLDDLLVLRTPRLAGTLADYERIVKQRATLLKSAGGRFGRRTNNTANNTASPDDGALATLDVWDAHLARVGSELLAERLAVVHALTPRVAAAYADVAKGAHRETAGMEYRPCFELPDVDPAAPDHGTLIEAFLAALEARRRDELDRGVCLVGPHRDDVLLTLEDAAGVTLPVRGYASHGESWSFALALRLAAYHLLREEGEEPVLILDDVFAELDATRRELLAAHVAGAEQVLVTAAVTDDIPPQLDGVRFTVADGEVHRE